MLREVTQVHVAWGEVAGRADDGDLRFLEVGIFEADGPQHGAGCGAIITVDDDGRMGACVFFGHSLA